MDNKNTPQHRRSSVESHASGPYASHRPSAGDIQGLSPAVSLDSRPTYGLHQQRRSSGGGMGPTISRSPQPPDIGEDTPFEGLDGEADPFFAGHELYRALRGDKGDDPLTDELLWEGDFMSTQRDFIQKKQEDEMLERLERRMGKIRAAPTQKTSAGGAADEPASAGSSSGGAPPALGGLAMAAATGVRLKNLLGRMIPTGSAAGGIPRPVSATGSAPAVAGRFESEFTSAPGQLMPVQPRATEEGPNLSLPESPAVAAQTTTPRFLARLASSFRRQASQKEQGAAAAAAAVGALGVLVAEDESKRKAAEALPPVEIAAQSAPMAASAGAAQAQPADAVVQVVKVVPKQLTAKQQEEKERAAAEELQRMDTDARLQFEMESYSWPRRMAVKICTHSDFELIVMLLIFANCVSLALYDPLQAEDSLHNKTLTKLDLGLNVAFTVEMVLRIISMGGLLHYLHHPWNAFDCVMVLAGYTTFIPTEGSSSAGLEGVKALRALRAMRPLRTITRFAALRSIVVCFLEAVPLLVSVAAMLFFFLFIFAVAASEIFGDAFHYGCTDPGTGAMEMQSVPIEDEFGCGDRQCPQEFRECRLYEQSLATQIAGFENVAISMLSVFQAMTLSNWSFTMFRTMDFLSPAVVIYWFVMIIFGAYFVLNLFLAVLKTKFAKAKNLLDEKRRQRRALKAGRGSKKRNVLARAMGWMKTRVTSYVSSKAGKDSLSSHVDAVVAKKTMSEFGDFGTPSSNLTGFTDFIDSQQAAGDPPGVSNTAPPAAGSVSFKPPVTRQLSRMDSSASGMSGYTGFSGDAGITGASGVSAVSAECLFSFEEFDESTQDLPRFKRTLLRAQYRVRALVCSSAFNNIYLLAILLNTVTLAIVYDGMSPQVEEALAYANFVFTGAFALEMILKLIGLGPWRYLSDAWNMFDALVVAFSLVELVTELMARSSANGLSALRSVRSLRVLRSFRVLRVMKMFKYLESLKMIAAVLISSMASFASIVVLLVLFWLVFSIVGLHVFGGLPIDVPFPNCDTLINSLILNFHILNLENFQISMYSVIRASSYASSMYWLAWIIIGKFIFLTLFLAVTLDAFERKYEADMKKGVRSQSMASTMFSRIKKAGQRVKSIAASMAGGSNSGRSTFSMWLPGASSKGSGGNAASHHFNPGSTSTSQHGGMSAAAAGTAMLLPGQASGDGVAVVSAAAGSSHAHSHRRSSAEHKHSRRTCKLGSDAGDPAGSQRSHQHRQGHSHHHDRRPNGEHRRSSTEDSRRPGGERRRSLDSRTASSPPGTAANAGPVAESAFALQEDFDINIHSSLAPGIRLRRLRAGMQQQYSCAKQQDADLQGSCGWGSGSIRSQLAAESYARRSSSSGSSNSSFTLKQEAAAAFAAAAAAEALGPCHVLPDLSDDDPGLMDLMTRQSTSSTQTTGTSSDWRAQHSSRSTSKSNSWNSQRQHQDGKDEADFTWQEFLATVAAINYPSLHRKQQQGQLLLEEGSARTVATAKTAASLGPIAEGLEHMDAAVPDQHVAPPSPKLRGASAEVGRLSFSSPGQLTAREMAGQAFDSPAQQQQQQSESPNKPGRTSPARSLALQQLALDNMDKELASLGLHPTGAEPTTPTLMFGSSAGSSFGKAAAASAADDSLWPGLDADTAEYSRRHAGSPVAPTESSSPAAASCDAPAQSAPDAKPAKDPARRVTLFTESMRNRGECPAPPKSPRFEQRVNSKAARQPAAPTGLKLDEILEQHATEASEVPAGGGSKAGSRPASAAGSNHSAAALRLLTEASVESGVTAQTIRRRKAAAVTFVHEEAPCCVSAAPQGIAESVQASGSGQGATGAVSFAAVPPPAGSEGQSQVSSARRTSRATSDNGSEGGLSDGGQSYTSGDGSRSGAWSTMSGMGRSRSRTFPELSGVSLWVFPQENRFRQALYDLVTNKYFDYLMFVLIILNCVAMAYEYPTMSKEDLDGKILFWSDVVFTAAFTIEAALKIIAFGFKPYLSFFQNIIDILIVISSLVMLFLDTMAEISVIKGLRVLRAIKPLRALTRSAGMQQIFKSLTLSLAAMGNVSIVVLLFFLIFAILGVQLFHGKFWSCNDPSVPDKDACTGTFLLDGQETERVWSNLSYNFDHLGMALVSLFITVTLNGYAEIMNAAMAAPEDPGLQPQPMSNWSAFFFFAAFVLVVGYTLLNLYIGVVFYQFSRIRMQSQTGSAFLTDDQTEWVEMSKLVFRLKPPEKSPVPVNKMRRKLYYLVQGKAFEYVIMAVIVANSALMATSYYGQPEDMSRIVEAINYAFTGVYVLEFVLKVVGLGWRNYWKNVWNKFDCILLITGLVDMAVTLAVDPGVASFLKIQKIMRLLRLARVVKLMRSMKGLRSLFGTLIVALPAFWNVGGLLALMFFIYAYVGMLLLGHVKRNGALNEHTNFERFWTAALTLFKVATNDNWTDVMMACMIGPPDCDPANDCGSWVVYPYFISFVVLVSIIMLQLFTAVIIESFEAQEEQDRWKLRPDHLDEFVELWAEYDDGSGTIDPKDLEAMLLRLSPPLGLGKGASSTDVLRFVFDLDIPLLNGRVPFQRTAYELVRRCSGAEIPEGILKDQINKLVTRAFRNLKADEVLNFSVAVTVMRVQRKWRARMRAAKMKRKKEFRADRGIAPAYADIIACRYMTLKSALQRQQAGDLRWRPSPAYAELWAAAEAVLAAEAAAAAVYSRRSSGSSVESAKAGPGGRWSSLAGLRASADGWMQRVTDGFAGGLQRIKGAGGGLFARSQEEGPGGARSGRSSLWGFASRATSKATSKATSVAGHDTAGQSAAASTVASRATSRAISDAASMVVSEVGTVDSAL